MKIRLDKYVFITENKFAASRPCAHLPTTDSLLTSVACSVEYCTSTVLEFVFISGWSNSCQSTVRPIINYVNIEIYVSQDFFLINYVNLEKKNYEIFGGHLAIFFCEVNLEIFLEIFVSRDFSRDFRFSRFTFCHTLQLISRFFSL